MYFCFYGYLKYPSWQFHLLEISFNEWCNTDNIPLSSTSIVQAVQSVAIISAVTETLSLTGFPTANQTNQEESIAVVLHWNFI